MHGGNGSRGLFRVTWRYRRGLGEIGLILSIMLLYYGTRGLAIGQEAMALANARAIVELERRLGLFHEPAFNAWVSATPAALLVLNTVYTYLHLPVLIAFAIWVYVRRQAEYAAIRNTFLVSAVAALLVYSLFPVAPPRLLPGYGFTDTLASYSNVSYELHSVQLFYNPYAAMPSLHFGWSLLVGLGLCWLGRGRPARALGVLLPLLMLIAIVGTANHFVLDALGGAAVLGLGGLIGFRARLAGIWQARGLAPSRTPY